jgi:hypothetical protein
MRTILCGGAAARRWKAGLIYGLWKSEWHGWRQRLLRYSICSTPSRMSRLRLGGLLL